MEQPGLNSLVVVMLDKENIWEHAEDNVAKLEVKETEDILGVFKGLMGKKRKWSREY